MMIGGMGQQNSYPTVIGIHLTMHLMHPNFLSDNYYVLVQYIHIINIEMWMDK